MAGSTLVEDDRGQVVSSVEVDATGTTAFAAYNIALSTQTLANNNASRITLLEGRADQFDIDLNAVEAVANAALAASSGGAKLETAGGTMTGFLTLHADPTVALHASTKGYVDGAIGTSLANYYTASQTYSKIETDARYAQLTGATFTGPVTLNANPTSALQAAPKQYVDNIALPAGIIVMWSGSSATIPSGWQLCDGTNGSPDLRDRFVIGAGSTYSPGNFGGTSSHSHTVTINGTALTVAQLPAHNHAITDPGHNHSITDPGHRHTVTIPGSDRTGAGSGTILGPAVNNPVYNTSTVTTGIGIISKVTGITIQNTGSGSTHTHTNTITTENHIPPYYALCFIMKL